MTVQFRFIKQSTFIDIGFMEVFQNNSKQKNIVELLWHEVRELPIAIKQASSYLEKWSENYSQPKKKPSSCLEIFKTALNKRLC